MASSILVVDDEQMVLASVDRLLTNQGYAVTCCDDSLRAVGLLQQEAFDLAILDVRMPRLSGIELLERLRDYERTAGRPPLPVIILTGFADARVVSRGRELGVKEIIDKPFDIAHLLASLKAHLGSGRGGEV